MEFSLRECRKRDVYGKFEMKISSSLLAVFIKNNYSKENTI